MCVVLRKTKCSKNISLLTMLDNRLEYIVCYSIKKKKNYARMFKKWIDLSLNILC